MRFPRSSIGISAIGAIAIFSIFVAASAPARAQDNCPAPRNLAVSQGKGATVPAAKVSAVISEYGADRRVYEVVFQVWGNGSG